MGAGHTEYKNRTKTEISYKEYVQAKRIETAELVLKMVCKQK